MYDLELLRKFCVVAKYCSFTKASEELYISQPALSKSIKLLESQMGIQLFERNTKKTVLTKEGSIIYNLIYPKIDYVCNIENFLDDLKRSGKFELKIGCNSTITRSILSPILKDYLNINKNINLSIMNRPTNSLIQALKNKEVDFIIINLPSQNLVNLADLNVIKLMDVQDVFIAGDKFNFLKNQTVKFKQLESYPIITNDSNSITREHFELCCSNNGVSIKPHIETVRNSLIIDFCALGLGIGFTNYNLMKKEIEDNKLFILKIEPEIPKRSIGIITRNEPNTSTIEDLISLLQRNTRE